jgi:hypothetical protein
MGRGVKTAETMVGGVQTAHQLLIGLFFFREDWFV